MKLPITGWTIPTKLLAIALPIAFLIVFLLLLTAGGVEQIGAQHALVAFALNLPVLTLYAIAIFGCAALVMRWTGLNIANEDLVLLWAKAGSTALDARDARRTIALQALCWAGALTLVACVFLLPG